MPAPSRASALAAAATVLALASAWHSGRHMWHRLQQDRATYAPLTGEQRARAPLTAIPLPADVFDWYASLLTRGDRVYYQVEPSGFLNFTFSDDPTVGQALRLFVNNMVVLLLHALICVVGYMGLRSMPLLAEEYHGWRRAVHRAAGVVAIVFVAVVTIGSFGLQAWSLGHAVPDIAAA